MSKPVTQPGVEVEGAVEVPLWPVSPVSPLALVEPVESLGLLEAVPVSTTPVVPVSIVAGGVASVVVVEASDGVLWVPV